MVAEVDDSGRDTPQLAIRYCGRSIPRWLKNVMSVACGIRGGGSLSTVLSLVTMRGRARGRFKQKMLASTVGHTAFQGAYIGGKGK